MKELIEKISISTFSKEWEGKNELENCVKDFKTVTIGIKVQLLSNSHPLKGIFQQKGNLY